VKALDQSRITAYVALQHTTNMVTYMNMFVSGFLDAPLLIARIENALRRASARNRQAYELHAMGDRELSDLLISRADIPHILEHGRP
jgi:uncharacterized protein YjiS (DUF1127 family)